jgi:drug/metabolite transporter (DMT)-like permease
MMNKEENKHRRALLATAGFSTIFGFSFMASRISLQYTSVDMLLALRFTVSMLAMLLLVIFGAFRIDLKGKPVGRFLILGLCQPVLYFIGETSGIKYTNSSFAGVMISLIPVVTAILSAIFLHELISLRTLGWIICSVIGVAIISVTQTGSGAIQFKGILLLALAVIAASVFYLLSRSSSDTFTPFERTFIMMVMGFVSFTAIAVVRTGSDFLTQFAAGITDWHVMLPVLYLSLLSSVVAFMLQNYAVTYMELSRITVFENIIPVISVVAGIVFLGEPFSLIQLAGIAMILLGVWKVTTDRSET